MYNYLSIPEAAATSGRHLSLWVVLNPIMGRSAMVILYLPGLMGVMIVYLGMGIC
jgi:hypothetical protein